MSTLSPHLLLLPLSLLLLLSSTLTTAQPPFQCTTTSTCMSLVGYISPNTTTLSRIQSLFQVKTLRSILGVNNLPPSTPRNHTVRANSTVMIPIPCRCFDGVGMSNHVPNYTVVKDDGLFHIASQVFSGLVEYPKIVTANNIKDPNLILVGQDLWIPLPCSCNDVDGEKVVHYGHVAASGSTVGQIAAEFGTTSETLMRLNNMSDPKSLVAGQVLDVPLKACSSSVSNSSPDFPMRIANGTYVYTANNCVMCTCDATNNYTMQCQPSGLTPVNWKTCPTMQCPESSLSLGNSTTQSACSRSTCAYAGFDKDHILTTLAVQNTCPGSEDNSSGALEIHWRGWSLAMVLFAMIMIQRTL
ncbi:LysM domain-containing GPI-anchored protein 2 [Bienertia sinuspersici]